MSEKYGFVYLWRDKKHKRYYVGCHWGTIEDGYICSSRWMRKSYRRRPEDFKRRILSIHQTRDDMRNEENRILSMISNIDLGKKYYNIYNHGFNHWSNDEIQKYIIGERISNGKTGKKHTKKREYTSEGLEKVKQNTREIQKLRTYSSATEETKKKQRESRLAYFENGGEKINSGSFVKGQKAWNEGKPLSEETKRKLSESLKGNTQSEETKMKRKLKLTGRIFIHNPMTNVQKMIFDHELEEFLKQGFVKGRLPIEN